MSQPESSELWELQWPVGGARLRSALEARETRVQIPSLECDPEQFSQLPKNQYLSCKTVERISDNLDKMPGIVPSAQ